MYCADLNALNDLIQDILLLFNAYARLDGVWGMRRFTALELHAIAYEYEAKLKDSENEDDPKWLQRRADRIRALAEKKEASIDHKNKN